jgi:hypothetical protein
MEVSVNKPGSPAELVKHSGVKGMSWGVRRQATRAAGREAAARTQKEALVRGAGTRRARVEARRAGISTAKDFSRTARAANPNVIARKAFRAEFPTANSKATAITQARREVGKAQQKFEREKDPVKREQFRQEYLNHPGRAIALRTTRGEKVALGLLTGLFGVVSPVGVGIGVGSGITIAKRRSIERQQAGG